MRRFHTKTYIPLLMWFLVIGPLLGPTHAAPTNSQHDLSAHCVSSFLSDLTIRAEDGDADALFERGLLLLYGHCLQENQYAGLLLLKSAAAKGHIEAAFVLGDLYADKSLRQLHDPNKAHQYLLFAAERNHLRAQHILGIILVRGDLGKDQKNHGLYWLGVAASARHELSAIIMGHLHEHGKYGIRQDPCLARDWYELCLMLGMHEAIKFIEVIDTTYTCN